MSRRVLSAVLGCFGLLAVQLAVASATEAVGRDQLVGTWTSTDNDGSHQILSIHGGGSGTYAMELYDDVASRACGGAPARISGTGQTVDDLLTMRGALTCSPGGNVFRPHVVLEFQFDPQTGLITDFSGVVWSRS